MGKNNWKALVHPLKDNNNNISLKIRNITNYITFPPQIAYELIEAGRSEDILQVQSLPIYRWTKLSNSKDTTNYTENIHGKHTP